MLYFKPFFVFAVFFSMTVGSASAQIAALDNPPLPAPLVDDFDDAGDTLPQGWKVIQGNWQIVKGALVADATQGETYISVGDPNWQNYEITADVMFLKVRDPSRWLSVLVRATPDGSKPWSQVAVRFDTTQGNGAEFAVRMPNNAWSVRSKAGAKAKFELNQSRRIKVTVRGAHVEGYLDGNRVVSTDFCVDRPNGCVGLGASGGIVAFDNISIKQLPARPTSTKQPAADKPATGKQCDIVAHRGFSSIAPENTLTAIRQAIKAGATGCEFDVYRCADGQVVLMHDKTVNRTTNGNGDVTGLTLEQLQKLDAGSWKDKKYAGEPVPTLHDALKLLKDTQCQPVIEIKMEGISRKVVEDVRALGMVEQVALIAFSQTVVREIRELEPKLTCAWLSGGIPPEAKANSVAQQADWLQEQANACKAKTLDLNYAMLSPELIAELKRRGLGVWCWTVNEPAVMKALQQWGVDSITTDRPLAALTLLSWQEGEDLQQQQLPK